MEFFLFGCLMTVLVVRWLFIRERFVAIENRLALLERSSMTPPAWSYPPQPRPEPPRPEPPVEPAPVFVGPPAPPEASLHTAPPVVEPAIPEPVFLHPEPQPRASRSSEEWEALIGGNWTNKIGILVFVISLALMLKYAYTEMGPAGRVALSLGVSFTMLAAGVIFERRETYRTFAYGLIGGGWAALYTTVYAMHEVAAAKVVDSALVATVMLLAVVAGMIVHSLKYRSEAVTGLAYFLAFVTLAISDATMFSVIAIVPLAVSLLYIAHRNSWSRFSIFGLIATYVTCGLHKDTGAPLLPAQSLFLVYWLVFEAFDLIRAEAWLLPLNALGFLLLSSGKWAHAAPGDIWQLAAGAAALYLGSTLLRARSDRWRPAVLLNAVLATTAIVLKLHGAWVPFALVVEGEIYYLAGVRFRSPYLRRMAGAIFLLQLGVLYLQDVGTLPNRIWEPVASLTVVLFYLNRALERSEVWYGYAAMAVAATIAGVEAHGPWRGRTWMMMALVPFTLGWWRRLFDFRMQGYALALAGVVGTAIYFPQPPVSLAIGIAVAYAFVHFTLWSEPDRFGQTERDALRFSASIAVSLGAATLVWRMVPGDYLGIAWLGLALVLLEAGLHDLPRDFRAQACLVGLLGATRVAAFDLSSSFALVSAGIVYAFAWRAQSEVRGRVTDVAVFPATLFLMAGLLAILPAAAVSAAWVVVAILLAEVDRTSLRVQSLIVSGVVFARCVVIDRDTAHAIAAIAPVIAGYWAAMLRRPRGSRTRLADSLLATTLLAALIYHEVSGSLLTVAWGLEGTVLLIAGFALLDRVPRLSGLALLLGCILKLFLWDLRNLDTLPRIFSFIVLGLLLVGVSWVYTRFRAQVRRYL